MDHNISEDHILFHIMNNLPNEYMNIVESIEQKLWKGSEPLTFFDVRDELTTNYKRIWKVKNIKEEELNGEE